MLDARRSKLMSSRLRTVMRVHQWQEELSVLRFKLTLPSQQAQPLNRPLALWAQTKAVSETDFCNGGS